VVTKKKIWKYEARDRLWILDRKKRIIRTNKRKLEKALTGTHGTLDVERANVLPILLEERDEEIDGETDVGRQIVGLHGDVTRGHRQAEDLFKLELDRGLQFLDLGHHIVSVSDHRWELAGFVQSGTQNTWNLLDEGVGGQKGVVLLGELFDQFLVLVQLLQRLLVHARDAVGRGLIAMLLISEDADGEFRPRDMTQLHGTRESFFLLGIVVLQVDLKLDGFEEFPLLFLGLFQHGVDALQNRVAGYFAHCQWLNRQRLLNFTLNF